MILKVDDNAPPFVLPQGPGQMVDAGAAFEEGPVLLLFYPLAFSSVCTEEFCTLRDDWSEWGELGVSVLGISVDSSFVAQKFRQLEELPFPLLSDFNKDVCASYGTLHDDAFGQRGISQRAVFLVARGGAIRYAWVGQDGEQVDFDGIRAAIAGL